MDDQVLEQHNKAAFGRADGEEQIDHPHDRALASQYENTPAAGLFENEPQTANLFILVRSKIAFLSEQFAQHCRQLIQVGFGCRLDHDVLFLTHRPPGYSKNRPLWQSCKLGPAYQPLIETNEHQFAAAVPELRQR